MDVDLNLVENMLSSYKAQAGLAGPASNLYGLLGEACVCVYVCIYICVCLCMHMRGVFLPDDVANMYTFVYLYEIFIFSLWRRKVCLSYKHVFRQTSICIFVPIFIYNPSSSAICMRA